ncbi:MAG: Holliday junction branch migration DNA helicase RuvB [Spirochaetia bacterium]|nr:Holliday junction branch migration DNA helicase RuvB [Spirochaetota bacterium]MCX8097352.1 Holliday junction branch migration DNA helicase RuvB [Spirochaetota bacterium]MDW8112009.1 Holliday junction branch migration DNA helicase RuvB [Spirochaetia bacterium]
MEDILSPRRAVGEDTYEEGIRPRYLDEFIGQESIKNNLKVFIDSSIKRNDILDHVLISGPPGLGKTTLAKIIANELRTNFVYTVSNSFQKVGDVVAILTNLQRGDVLFIDEIHRLKPSYEEVLYSAMEDYSVSVMIGEGPGAKSIKINIPKFTLIGATTRTGLLTSPLISRFGILLKVDFYSDEDMGEICERTCRILGLDISNEAIKEIAKRSRGTPRVLNRILRRIRDFAVVEGVSRIELGKVREYLLKLGIDEEGLDEVDRKILSVIVEKYQGGPVGLKTLSASIGEEEDTIEDVFEPFLILKGFIKRTPKGRVATELAYQHLGIPKNSNSLF